MREDQGQTQPTRSWRLTLAFFCSGAAALVFETLWFRQVGLMLGNSVWAAALVVSAFMGGLAVGNAWAERWARRFSRPLRVYALLEAATGASGLVLVLAMPWLTATVAPWLALLTPRAELLQLARAVAAFLLMALPASAMGATLPIAVRAVPGSAQAFGRVLGWLYGWNTLGAVVGALAADAVLVASFGVSGAAVAGAVLSLAAAALALGLAQHTASLSGEAQSSRATRSLPLSLAAFLAGAGLLALEVIWFRLLLLFVYGSAVTFGCMLAVVLLGISSGGLLASSLLRLRPQSAWLASTCSLLASVACVATYAGLGPVLEHYPFRLGLVGTLTSIFMLALALMLPVALLSGVLFTLLGEALRAEAREAGGAAGRLTLLNTLGAATGAAAASLLILPGLGVERALFAIAALYSLIGVLLWCSRAAALQPPTRNARFARASAAGLAASFLLFYPFGLMRNYYTPGVVSRFTDANTRVVEVREGLTETAFALRTVAFGAPVEHRLVTNGYSMSSTGLFSRRYMAMFAYLPATLRPGARKALLISYGVGNTAQALVNLPGLESIDVVDISKDILELSGLVFSSGADPLSDPRVHVHVEDGRFFLMTSREKYDVITAEPPPPKLTGVVSLYTREYFRLARERLAEGGVLSYWLPIYQMEPREAQALVTGFCDAFDDCSLWTGSGLELILLGTRNLSMPLPETGLEGTDDVNLRRALVDLGLEAPEQFGTALIADADELRSWARGVSPLDDDHPFRLSHRHTLNAAPYMPFLNAAEASRRFGTSGFVRRLWPEPLRRRTQDAFWIQQIVNDILVRPVSHGTSPSLRNLDQLLVRTRLRAPVLWAMGQDDVWLEAAARAAASGASDPAIEEALGARALAERDFAQAARHLANAPQTPQLLRWRVLALALAGDLPSARDLLAAADPRFKEDRPDEWTWLSERLARDELPKVTGHAEN